MQREHTNDLLAIPFVLCWQVTLFLLPMQLMIRSYAAFRSTLVLFVIGMAGMYWFWYRHLPLRTSPVLQSIAEPVTSHTARGGV